MTNLDMITLEQAILHNGKDTQTDMAIEEMSELTKALLKFRRYEKGDRTCGIGRDLIDNVREEIADVQIMLDQMKLIYGFNEGVLQYKINRLKKRLQEEENHE